MKKIKHVLELFIPIILIVTLFLLIHYSIISFTAFFIVGYLIILIFMASFRPILDSYSKSYTKEQFKFLKILRITLIAIVLLIIILDFVIRDPYHLLVHAARVYMFLFFAVLYLLCFIPYLFIKGKNKIKYIVCYIIVLLITSVFIYQTTKLDDDNKDPITSSEFESIMTKKDYLINEAHGIDNIETSNEKIIVAYKDDVFVYFIESENRIEMNKVFDSFYEGNLVLCKSNSQTFENSGLRKRTTCSDPDYVKTAYKIKNTMIYIEGNSKNNNTIEEILEELGYTN